MNKIDRRTFIKLSMLGAAGVGLVSGCGIDERTKEQTVGLYGGQNNHIYPYVNQPPGLQDGVPQWFATTCTMCSAGCGIIVRTLGGRAVKVEGNPDHPIGQGSTCARAQASLQTLYNPDRLRFPRIRTVRGQAAANASWDDAIGLISNRIQGSAKGVAVLVDSVAYGQSEVFEQALGNFASRFRAKTYHFGLMDDLSWRAASKAVYGTAGLPYYKIDEADYIVSFNANFLEAWPSPVMYGRMFGDFRQGPRRPQGQHGRFVYVGPRMSMTAAKADKWLPCRPGSEGAVALAVLGLLGKGGLPVDEAAQLSGLSVRDITALASEFSAGGKRAVAMGGDGSASTAYSTETLTAVESLNLMTGTSLVGVSPSSAPARPSHLNDIKDLMSRIKAGAVDVVLILGQPNPVFTLPQASGLGSVLSQVPFIAALTPFEDETTAVADVVCPTRTSLEEWSDNSPLVSPAGLQVSSIVQPVIDPAFIKDRRDPKSAPWMDTRAIIDVLGTLSSSGSSVVSGIDGQALLRSSYSRKGQANLSLDTQNDDAWRSVVGKGGIWTKAGIVKPESRVPGQIKFSGLGTAPPSGSFVMVAYPQLYWTGGRHSNLPWLQEISDPMTAAVWNSWVEINRDVANKLDINTGDIVRLSSAHGFIDLPALPYPAIHPEALGVPIGQGHTSYGRTAQGRGSNPLSIVEMAADPVTGAWAYGQTVVSLRKIRSAEIGYQTDINTLVTMNDIPGGNEPDAVKGLIHETAIEKRSMSVGKQK